MYEIRKYISGSIRLYYPTGANTEDLLSLSFCQIVSAGKPKGCNTLRIVIVYLYTTLHQQQQSSPHKCKQNTLISKICSLHRGRLWIFNLHTEWSKKITSKSVKIIHVEGSLDHQITLMMTDQPETNVCVKYDITTDKIAGTFLYVFMFSRGFVKRRFKSFPSLFCLFYSRDIFKIPHFLQSM